METITLKIPEEKASMRLGELLEHLSRSSKSTNLSMKKIRGDKRVLNTGSMEYLFPCEAIILRDCPIYGEKHIATYEYYDKPCDSFITWELMHRGIRLKSPRLDESIEVRPSFSSVSKIKDEILRSYAAAFYDGL